MTSKPKPAFNAKKARLYNSRAIKTQIQDGSLVEQERLNVPLFLEARAFEIKSFELSQLRSKSAASNRAFQSLPRTLRRRAASHNVKRIPKRLRSKALREMKSSTNGIPPKKEHLRGRKLYRLRMSKKLLKWASRIKLLKSAPEAVVYDKSVNIRGKIKALNKQIQELSSTNTTPTVRYNNCVGSYDNTGINVLAPKPRGNIKYHKRQTLFVWLPTHVWHAKRFHIISQYGFKIPLSPTQKCFKAMNRCFNHGSVIFDASYNGTMILQFSREDTLIKFLLETTRYTLKIPTKIRAGSKLYNDWVFSDGKKIGMGLLYVSPEHFRVMIRVFPSLYESLFSCVLKRVIEIDPEASVQDCRYSLGSIEITGPTALNTLSKVLHVHDDASDSKVIWSNLAQSNDRDAIPVGTTFCFDFKDPRFWKQPLSVPAISHPQLGNNVEDMLIYINGNGKALVLADSANRLLSPKGRTDSYLNQNSIKSIGQKFSKIDPNSRCVPDLSLLRVPILVTKISKSTWTVILPWYWVLPLWIKLSRTRDTKVGGMRQSRQANFMRGEPSFPIDFPYLPDGYDYGVELAKENELKFRKIPAHHANCDRPDFALPRIFSPFGCDWRTLRDVVFLRMSDCFDANKSPSFASFEKSALERDVRTYHDRTNWIIASRSTPVYTSSAARTIPIELFNPESESHRCVASGTLRMHDSKERFTRKLCVIPVSIQLVQQGTLKDGARIYASNSANAVPNFVAHPLDIIGFVTSGALNLNLGRASGIGAVSATIRKSPHRHVYVRNIGCSEFYFAKYEEMI